MNKIVRLVLLSSVLYCANTSCVAIKDESIGRNDISILYRNQIGGLSSRIIILDNRNLLYISNISNNEYEIGSFIVENDTLKLNLETNICKTRNGEIILKPDSLKKDRDSHVIIMGNTDAKEIITFKPDSIDFLLDTPLEQYDWLDKVCKYLKN